MTEHETRVGVGVHAEVGGGSTHPADELGERNVLELEDGAWGATMDEHLTVDCGHADVNGRRQATTVRQALRGASRTVPAITNVYIECTGEWWSSRHHVLKSFLDKIYFLVVKI